MKKQIIYVVPFTMIFFLLVAYGCSKDDENNNNSNTSQESLLTAHSWTTYKILNNGNDVTSSVTPMILDFNSNGSFTASGLGSSSGSWSLNGSTLDLGSAGTWTILELASATLKIKDSSGAVEAHFN